MPIRIRRSLDLIVLMHRALRAPGIGSGAMLGMILAVATAVVWTKYYDGYMGFMLYMLPVGIPFLAFMRERITQSRKLSRVQFMIEIIVIAVAMSRAVFPIPFISGHALFLAYALGVTGDSVTRMMALAVILQVIAAKFVMTGTGTLVGGIVIGTAAAVLFHRFDR